MKVNRRKHSPSFKAKVALEALKGEETGRHSWRCGRITQTRYIKRYHEDGRTRP